MVEIKKKTNSYSNMTLLEFINSIGNKLSSQNKVLKGNGDGSVSIKEERE